MVYAGNMATIRDVAHHAGVSVGTVSRVMNGGTYVSHSTRNRVLATIDRLGYRPNAQARRILRRRADTVLFLLNNREFLHPFHARILQGVETYASTIKQNVIFAAVHYEADTTLDRIRLPLILQERGWIDGAILAGTVYPNLLQKIRGMGIPLVVFGNNACLFGTSRNFSEVGFDGLQAEFEATQYVIQQGHRATAFVGDTYFPWIQERHKGYLRALEAAELKPASLTKPHNIGFREFGELAASVILKGRIKPTAILAGNDEIAYGLWRCFRRAGLGVPNDVSLVGFDDREEALLMDPPLTTIRVPKEKIGAALMKLLIENLHEPALSFSKVALSTELVIRESVKRL